MPMASWGTREFTVSANRIAALEGLTTSLTLKADSENDTSGTQPTNTRGRELRPISFNVTYLAAAGIDVRAEIDAWEAELGQAYPLIIGGERFGAAKMTLTQVTTTDVWLSSTGAFLRATVSLTLEEYAAGKTSQLLAASGTATLSAAASAAEAAKKAALAATASAADRAGKSPLVTTEVMLN